MKQESDLVAIDFIKDKELGDLLKEIIVEGLKRLPSSNR